MLKKVVIASACRTAIGDLLGTLKDVHPRELGRIVGAEALKRAGLAPGQVDEVVCGNVIQAGVGGNISRQIQAALGIPWQAPACTVNQLCASSMRAFEINSAPPPCALLKSPATISWSARAMFPWWWEPRA